MNPPSKNIHTFWEKFFGIHEWSKWYDVGVFGTSLIQEKICPKCGKKQRRLE